MQPPSHLQTDVQWRDAFEHLQLRVQDLVQLQWIKSEHAWLTSASTVQNGTKRPLSFVHPHSVTSGIYCSGCKHLPQMKAACRSDRLICWYRASCVGGIPSSKRFPWENNMFLASLTLLQPEPLLYRRTTKRSSWSIWTDTGENSSGFCVSSFSVPVSSGKDSQIPQVVFFPLVPRTKTTLILL